MKNTDKEERDSYLIKLCDSRMIDRDSSRIEKAQKGSKGLRGDVLEMEKPLRAFLESKLVGVQHRAEVLTPRRD